MIRLFIALPLPPELERRLGEIIEAFRPRGNAVKWSKPGNIHLTVKFLGDTDEKLVPEIGQALGHIAARTNSIKAVIDQLGGFPNLRRPRVIWAGSSLGIEAAGKVARDVDLSLRQLGFQKEKRPFKAHLTLGRVRQGKTIDDLAPVINSYRLEPVTVTLDKLTLFKSTLTAAGPIYEKLHEAPLGQERFGG